MAKSSFLKGTALTSLIAASTVLAGCTDTTELNGSININNGNNTSSCDLFADSFQDEATVVNGYQFEEDGYYKFEGNLIIQGDVNARFVTIDVEDGDVYATGNLARGTSIYNKTNISENCFYGDLFDDRPEGTVAGINVTGYVGSGSYLQTNGSINVGGAARSVEMVIGHSQTITINGVEQRKNSQSGFQPPKTP